jgi:hypothetical protein
VVRDAARGFRDDLDPALDRLHDVPQHMFRSLGR